MLDMVNTDRGKGRDALTTAPPVLSMFFQPHP
jgi:hypothetical protein